MIKKKMIDEIFPVDQNRLYDVLPNAILYLQEVAASWEGADISLHEHWTGYEDMEMSFCVTRLETDEEFMERQAQEKQERKRKKAEADKAKLREDKLKQLNKLKRELGIR